MAVLAKMLNIRNLQILSNMQKKKKIAILVQTALTHIDYGQILKKLENMGPLNPHHSTIQAFLHFRCFDFPNFWFNTVYKPILFSLPLVLLSNLDFCGFHFLRFFYGSPH